MAQVPPGLGGRYLGELEHTGRQVLQLAEAMPEEKYSWRPAPGVMSVAEVFTHVYAEMAGKARSKAEILDRLKRSLAEVKMRYEATSSKEMHRPVKFLGSVDSKVENVYLRILAHVSEHMGQSIAYARMNGVVPPWSRKP